MGKYIKKLCHIETGFTIVEILVVVAILAALAVVVGVNFGKYIGQGKEEAYATELHDIRTAVAAMLHDSTRGDLAPVVIPTDDMSTVHTDDPQQLVLSDYLKKLNFEDKVISGCTYTFTQDGIVKQIPP
ncbi:type II secretion system protein [Chloroflexota bacterium]